MSHQVMIVDYSFHGTITCFIKIQGFDAENNIPFEGVIRMVDGVPYGDLIREGTSNLSKESIRYVKLYLEKKYIEGYFS
ncbi:hypothetical protein [uncultured Rummeliibacillus sp.]|uniref:hypothetical protein n=1 Tax=uncultured Rummeliibacillus sp. TaxID=762292 RepID=UPI0026160E3D|nr:hypothetical protein [uncultured Rummeliibacillus sp.]